LLAFATIMLNTDAHSPQIKKKMTKAEFLNNTKFINNGGPLPRDYMENLYEKIVADEIKMETEGKMWSTAEKKGWLTKQG
jgi:Sec7-like guanine-nucleotide exchange factor